MMITISKPKLKDAENINEVIKRSWYDTYINEQIGITKKDIDLMYAESEGGQIEMFRNRAIHQRDDDISLVVRDGENFAGFIRLKIETGEVKLLSMYILPEYVGKGIGTKLWSEALKFTPKDMSITTEVATYTKAKDFYEKIGFVDMGKEHRSQSAPMLSSGSRIPLMKMIFVGKSYKK
jgi:ribosomal protein S18 acetylase RimI-like enzyme